MCRKKVHLSVAVAEDGSGVEDEIQSKLHTDNHYAFYSGRTIIVSDSDNNSDNDADNNDNDPVDNPLMVST